jgi:hypothetical protein
VFVHTGREGGGMSGICPSLGLFKEICIEEEGNIPNVIKTGSVFRRNCSFIQIL